jgi:hypothetical protein
VSFSAEKRGVCGKNIGGCGEKVENSGEKCTFAGDKKMYHMDAWPSMDLLARQINTTTLNMQT